MLFVLSPQDVRIPFLSRATRRPIPLTSACVMRSGKLDYAAFCELVMGSSSEDITSFAASPTRRMDQPAVLPGDARSFEVSVRRRVIDNWKDLKNLFTHLENLPVRNPSTHLRLLACPSSGIRWLLFSSLLGNILESPQKVSPAPAAV